MQDCKVNILGTEWEIKFGSDKEYPGLFENDGYADSTTKEIVVDNMELAKSDPGSKGNLEVYKKSCVRHEIIHAFMEESGLSGNFEHKPIGIDESILPCVRSKKRRSLRFHGVRIDIHFLCG